jgi:transposase InsO family protein
VLTDNGIQFADICRRTVEGLRQDGVDIPSIASVFVMASATVSPNHPWTNGQVERMNRTIKEATVKRFFYDTHEQVKAHLSDFIAAYNFARQLKTLRGLTPYEAIYKLWTHDPNRFTLNPNPPNAGTKHLVQTKNPCGKYCNQ